jgi:hypothetical protein
MKKLLFTSTMMTLALATGHASVTISGTAISGAPHLVVGQTVAMIADTSGSGFDASSIFNTTLGGSIAQGLSITDGATYGAGIVFLDSTIVVNNFLSTPIAAFGTTFDLGAVSADDEFAFVVFDSSSATTLISDTYALYTNSGGWLVPSDSGNNAINPQTSASTFGGTVVPEPSTFSALAGLCALGAVMVRRRRA